MPEQCLRIIDGLIESRKAKGWTQQDLSRTCGLTQSVIARIENKKSCPTLTTLQKVASSLGLCLLLVSDDSTKAKEA